ncbi:hypothetical protein [Leifsonia aquatica]|uniref:hypothetical protein n=1 Tax=Leifsonia aquatica TaxID=144185 RepID=UPI0013B3CEDE|nr:hypothetical protein [Leifsonia aquatica]
MERDKRHKQMWADRLAAIQSTAATRQADLIAKVEAAERRAEALEIQAKDLRAALESGLQSVPPDVIASYFETDAVRTAHEARDSAYRQRDTAMRAIWRVEQLHHPETSASRKCSCGTTSCAVERAVSRVADSMLRWERNQIDRVKACKRDQLPDEHPDAKKYRKLYADSTDWYD